MTDKVTLLNVGDGSIINAPTVASTVNYNSAAIVAALDNTLSRDGTAPNQMEAPLDMNNNPIINLPTPVSNNSPVRLVDLNTAIAGGTIHALPAGGTTKQILAKNSATDYDVTWNSSYVPAGGTSGQFLAKNSASDYDYSWQTNPSGAVTVTPGGRLTLTSGTPVMNSSVTAATTIYYAPYRSKYVPLNVGGVLGLYAFTASATDSVGLSVSLGSNWAANSNYDWFIYNDGGTIRLGSGPDWSAGAVAGSNTIGASTRGTGAGSTELQMYNGILTNKNAMTLRYGNAATVSTAANTCTYVGTTRTGNAGQISFTYGFQASGGGAANLYVWNAYNQVLTSTSVTDQTSSWTYLSSTIRASNGSSNNRVNFITGLAQGGITASVNQLIRTAAVSAAYAQIGVAMNSTVTFDRVSRASNLATASSTLDISATASNSYAPILGANYISFNESGDNANTSTFFGLTASGPVQSLAATLVM
jgi:hypothetical protein